MADQKPQVKFISPKGVAVYPKLNKPDTKFNAAGEFRAKILIPAGDIPTDLTEKLTKLRDGLVDEKRAEFKGKKELAKAKALKVLDIWKDNLDKETGEPTGQVVLSAKMKASGVSKKDGKPWTRAVKLFTANQKKFDPAKLIWGGSELKLAVTAAAYYMAKENEVGIAFYLDAVQVIKLVSTGGENAGDFGFGEEEGYVGEDEAATDAPFDGETKGDSGNSKAADEF